MIYCALFTMVSGALGGFVGRRRALVAVASEERAESVSEASVETEEAETEEATDKAAK